MPFAGETGQNINRPTYGKYRDMLETGGTGVPWMESQNKKPVLSSLSRASDVQDRAAARAQTLFVKHRTAAMAEVRKLQEYQRRMMIPGAGASQRLAATSPSKLPFFSFERGKKGQFIAEARVGQYRAQLWKRQVSTTEYMRRLTLYKGANAISLRGWGTSIRKSAWGIQRTVGNSLKWSGAVAKVIGRVSIWYSVFDLIVGIFRAMIRFARPIEKVAKNVAKAKALKRAAQKAVVRSFNNKTSFNVHSMEATIKIDTSKFEAAMKQYVQNSKRDFKDIVNQKCYWVAINSIKMTYKGDKNKIETELNQPSKQNPDYTLAEFLVMTDAKWKAARMTKAQMRSKAKKLINTRKRSVAFLRSGWIPAIKALAPIVEKRVGASLEKEKGRPKGGGRPALTSVSPVASAWNDIDAGFSPIAANYMQQGLQMALDKEARSMIEYCEKKMAKSAAIFNRS